MGTRHQLVVGTAGHIDHGKSRLVLALTGTDPDQLAEEKARGMTIDLGFAVMDIDDGRIYLVDVPGHERFIRNMVAGATGIDVAMLVVAADDSVMPQTREHAELLSLLGVTRCIVALNKIDLVDEEWADVVEEEVRELLTSLDITPLSVVRTSAETGAGLDELRELLARTASARDRSPLPYNWFRMPIDRAFSVPGRGTVTTGTVAHGDVHSGDELELWPEGQRVRVRDLQTHHADTDAVSGRVRLAVNLANIAVDDVERGCELSTPGCMERTQWLDAWIPWLRMPGKELKQKLRLRLHIATREALVEARLIETPTSNPVRQMLAQLKVAEPIVATWGQRFILRDESGKRTLGGGMVLRPVTRPWSSKHPPYLPGLEMLRTGDEIDRLEEIVRACEWRPCDNRLLATRAGLAGGDAVEPLLNRLRGKQRIQVFDVAGIARPIHASHLEAFMANIAERLAAHLAENPRSPGVPRAEWPAWMPRACPEKLYPALTEWLYRQKCVVLENDRIRLADQQERLSDADQALLDAILAEFRAGRFTPPAPTELACLGSKNQKRVRELLDWALTRGQLVRVADGLLLHGDCWREGVSSVVRLIRERGDIGIGDLRDLLGSSRKFVVPIAERLDALGITRRVGDNRVLGPAAEKPNTTPRTN
ncbi:MAG: selenocysteine-specific translation elongation factor [Phycisphaerae bacterium]|nr:selenocysteine-specific translation elongation factor [Phycisphaerae bacterium]